MEQPTQQPPSHASPQAPQEQKKDGQIAFVTVWNGIAAFDLLHPETPKWITHLELAHGVHENVTKADIETVLYDEKGRLFCTTRGRVHRINPADGTEIWIQDFTRVHEGYSGDFLSMAEAGNLLVVAGPGMVSHGSSMLRLYDIETGF